MHLPELPEQPTTSPEAAAEDVVESESSPGDDVLTGTLLFNPALSGASGLLCGKVEPRWERSADGLVGRPGLWCEGQRLESWTPEDSGG